MLNLMLIVLFSYLSVQPGVYKMVMYVVSSIRLILYEIRQNKKDTVISSIQFNLTWIQETNLMLSAFIQFF